MPAVLRNLGFLRILQQRGDDAERVLRQSLALNGADPRALELMGLLCVQRENPQEAKTWLLKALSLQPRDPRTLRLLGITCEHLGDFKCAEIPVPGRAGSGPRLLLGLAQPGRAAAQEGRPGGRPALHPPGPQHPGQGIRPATSSFPSCSPSRATWSWPWASCTTSPPWPRPRRSWPRPTPCWARSARDLGDLEGATSYFSLATETDPKAADPWAALGDMARADCRWEDALRCYREALARKPDAADLQVQIGYILLNTGQYDEGEQLFLTALEADPGEYSAYLGLSECYRNLQRPEDQLRHGQAGHGPGPRGPGRVERPRASPWRCAASARRPPRPTSAP